VQVVNLLVTPEQAQTLSLATSELRIQLVLRNPLDTKVSQVSTTAMGQMFGDQGAVAKGPRRAPRAAPRTFTIEIINGANTTQQKFRSPEAKQ
jgi:pilus assembly protein CpaB